MWYRRESFSRRDEPSARRMVWAFVGFLVVVGVFWMVTSDRFGSTDPALSVADVGPQTLAQLTGMGKPGVLEIYTSSCPWCAKMESEMKKLEDQYGDSLFVVKMNAEKYPSEAGQFNVQAVPTVVYFDAAGDPVEVIPGYADLARMTAKLKELKLLP